MPMTPFIGVRISWLMLARKSLLARVAAIAASRARRSSASNRLRSVMSSIWTTKWSGSPASSLTSDTLRMTQMTRLSL